jgi:hypothetical protein
MKRILSVILAVSFIFALAGCGKEPKEDIFHLVEKNYEKIVTACENKDADALLAVEGITKVNIVDGYVVVFCKGAGISVSSQDYGFYYTEENIPVTVDCCFSVMRNVELFPEGNGYQGVVQGNTFYTEHIKGKLYFYSNAY